MKTWLSIIATAAVALSVALSACGGGSSTTSPSTAESPSAATKTSKTKSASKAESNGTLPGISEGNEVATFGQEAAADEREAASKVLEENLSARAAEDWSKQCASLSARLTAELLERVELIMGKKEAGGCPKALELEAEPISPSVLKNPMTGPIDELRVEGPKAYALFTGTGNKEYGMPMVSEGGEWKVDSLTTIELSEA